MYGYTYMYTQATELFVLHNILSLERENSYFSSVMVFTQTLLTQYEYIQLYVYNYLSGHFYIPCPSSPRKQFLVSLIIHHSLTYIVQILSV